MYTGFKINADEKFEHALYNTLRAFPGPSHASHAAATRVIADALDRAKCVDGSIDAEKLGFDWFPELPCSVFISHSHKDLAKAKLLSGWLADRFGISSFIDSMVWGYCQKLIWQIDEQHRNLGSMSYDYAARNISTSNIHMILANALAVMLNKCECVIFLETSNSINSGRMHNNYQRKSTNSPWIFLELSLTKILTRQFKIKHSAV
jgi:hypothetical protein